VLGDALWLPTEFPTESVHKHFHLAAAEHGMARLRVRTNQLEKEREVIHATSSKVKQIWMQPQTSAQTRLDTFGDGIWAPVNPSRIRK